MKNKRIEIQFGTAVCIIIIIAAIIILFAEVFYVKTKGTKEIKNFGNQLDDLQRKMNNVQINDKTFENTKNETSHEGLNETEN